MEDVGEFGDKRRIVLVHKEEGKEDEMEEWDLAEELFFNRIRDPYEEEEEEEEEGNRSAHVASFVFFC